MPRLPRAHKLNLAVRKQVRDEYESQKPNYEKRLSDILGETWTIEVDPLALWPYAAVMGEPTTNSFGHIIRLYLTGAIYRLELHAQNYGATGTAEINKIAHAHTLTIDVDETVDEAHAFAHCGVDIHEGRVRLLFAATAFGSNCEQCLDNERLPKALNAAPGDGAGDGDDETGLSYAARTSVAQDWEAESEAVRAKLAAMVGNPGIKFVPNFKHTFAKLAAESKRKGTGLRADWEGYLGRYTYLYFETLVSLMPGPPNDFEQDQMLKEAFNDAVDSGEIAFRIVDKLVEPGYNRYCECQAEGGVLCLQTTVERWGVNPHETYSKLLEVL